MSRFGLVLIAVASIGPITPSAAAQCYHFERAANKWEPLPTFVCRKAQCYHFERAAHTWEPLPTFMCAKAQCSYFERAANRWEPLPD